MRKLVSLATILALNPTILGADPSLAPALTWVTTLGGSGANQVAAAAADSNGNLYIAGTTTSLDFPVTSGAAQSAPGSSTLIRVTTASGVAQKLYPAGLSTATSIAADPQNPQTVYATQANTVWRSTDGGTTWASLSALPVAAQAGCLAVDPFDGNILYAGTFPLGIFKSSDAGATWMQINTGIPTQSNGSLYVSRIWTDPGVARVVFASSDQGLLRSADGGASWNVAVTAGILGSALAFDLSSPGTLYIATAFSSAISRSTDDGKTFSSMSSLPDQSPVVALITDPNHAGTLFAGSYSGIYQSPDRGVTWTKKTGILCRTLLADPKRPVLYALSNNGLISTVDGFTTTSPISLPVVSALQMVAAGSSLFLVASPTRDVFIVKLDSNGRVVYSTYFGGSSDDVTAGLAVGSDGSVFLTGTTSSIDFPTTKGAYAASINPSMNGSNFVFKLNPDGSLAWSTYFADASSTAASIAADAAGNVYIAGSSAGNLPTTAGAYLTQFKETLTCPGIVPCIPGPPAAFVTKFNPNGSGLIFSTYVSMDSHKTSVQNAQTLLVDPIGNTYFGGNGNIVLLNATGSAILGSMTEPVNISALALDSAGNLYATGYTSYQIGEAMFPATSGAFQTVPLPAIPNLPTQLSAGGGADAFVMKWDAGLTKLLAATLLGGELTDQGEGIAVDSSGNVIVAGFTDSKAFPTRAPSQEAFSARAGFVVGLDTGLSNLRFSTYLGDDRPFATQAAIPDGNGNILLAGSTLAAGSIFVGGDPGGSYNQAALIVANKIALPPAPALRLDSVVNFASRMAGALAPGEAIAAVGAGFSSDAQVLIDGSQLPVISGTATSLVAAIPDNAKTSGAFQVQVSVGGALSNTVLVPAAPSSPGIYSVDGSGYGQGYILNSDGTLNSPSNPAAPNSAITILATGAGAFNLAGPYAVTALMPAVFIDGFYADGIAAIVGPVTGLPGNVFQLGVYVPEPSLYASYNPNLTNFAMPPQVPVKLVFGPVNSLNPDNSTFISQPGLVLNVKQ
jgi:uncharacterized protein (TIGR03437 family)